MLAQIDYPQQMSPQELDEFLAQGWFRMGQAIFTTNFLCFKNQVYSALWLRIQLTKFTVESTHRKIIRQNAHFRTEISPATITLEKEALYTRYKEVVPFNASASLQHLLFGKTDYNIYNTQEVTVWDKDKLIAVGYFDLGADAAAGISSFYDPDYKRFSLGKYLIFTKLDYSRQHNLRYFYPGYFAPGYPAFDYKLSIGRLSLEYFRLANRDWMHIDSLKHQDVPHEIMKTKLLQLQLALAGAGMAYNLYQYEFFDVNLVPDLKGVEVFDYPVFLMAQNISSGLFGPVVVYDVRHQRYHACLCYSLWSSGLEPPREDIYVSHLLKVHRYLFDAETAQAVAQKLLHDNLS